MGGTISSIPEVSMDGFQVVSGDMFGNQAHYNVPTITLWYNSVSFSKAAIVALNSCERILIKVNPEKKCILIIPVSSKDKDNVRWLKSGKAPQAKKLDCIQFTSKLYETWGWEKGCCYRATGRLVMSDQKVMLLFDLSAPESWKYKKKEQVKKPNEE